MGFALAEGPFDPSKRFGGTPDFADALGTWFVFNELARLIRTPAALRLARATAAKTMTTAICSVPQVSPSLTGSRFL